MHRFLHDYFWIYIVVIPVLFGAVFYFTPRLVMKFLNKGTGEKNQRLMKNEPSETSNDKSRYKTF